MRVFVCFIMLNVYIRIIVMILVRVIMRIGVGIGGFSRGCRIRSVRKVFYLRMMWMMFMMLISCFGFVCDMVGFFEVGLFLVCVFCWRLFFVVIEYFRVVNFWDVRLYL